MPLLRNAYFIVTDKLGFIVEVFDFVPPILFRAILFPSD